MNLLILEPPYSKLFKDLAVELNPNKTFVHLFNLGYMIYLPWRNSFLVNKEIKKIVPSLSSIERVKQLKNLINSNIRTPYKDQILIMARYLEYLENFIQTNSITHIICHNDLRWQHSIAKEVSKKLGINIYFSEEGLFRPDTLTFDSKGVNANSSVPRERNFYFKNSFKPTNELTQTPVIQSKRIFRIINFVIFLCLNQIGEFLKINVKLKNKQYSFVNYLKLFFHKLNLRKKQKSPSKPLSNYIFVPLQVSNDTQTIIHSPFKGTQEFISLVEQSFNALNGDLRSKFSLVFKKHPMESHVNYIFSHESIVSEMNTGDLLKSAELVILINSTTIVEALSMKKKVISLGDSHYNIEGIIYKSSIQNLEIDLRKYISEKSELDLNLLDSFLNFLKYHYQINGNIFYYNNSTLTKLKDIISLSLASKDQN